MLGVRGIVRVRGVGGGGVREVRGGWGQGGSEGQGVGVGGGVGGGGGQAVGVVGVRE